MRETDIRPTLAVFGGSFNPPHVGHVLLPAWLLSQGLAARVLVAPCETHALGKSLPPFEQRLAWTRAAMAQHGPSVIVSDLERRLAQERLAAGDSSPSYALGLLERVARDYPDHRIRLVVGSDIIDSGETARWHRWDLIERDYPPIVVPRAGGGAHGALPEVSSSQIRAVMAQAQAAGDLESLATELGTRVPASVLAMLLPPRKRVLMLGTGHASAQLASWLSRHRVHVDVCSVRACLGDSSVLDSALAGAPWAGDGATRANREETSEAVKPQRHLPWDAIFVVTREVMLPELDSRLAERLVLAVPTDGDASADPHAGVRPLDVPIFQCAGQAIAALAMPRCAALGVPLATAHPICVLRQELPHSGLETAFFGVEGDPRAKAWLAQLVPPARWLELDRLDASQRTAYHAACSLDANFLGLLLSSSRVAMNSLGLAPPAVEAATIQLMQSSLAALVQLGVPGGISGPAARGDHATVEAHLRALEALTGAGGAADLYRLLADLLARRLAAPP